MVIVLVSQCRRMPHCGECFAGNESIMVEGNGKRTDSIAAGRCLGVEKGGITLGIALSDANTPCRCAIHDRRNVARSAGSQLGRRLRYQPRSGCHLAAVGLEGGRPQPLLPETHGALSRQATLQSAMGSSNALSQQLYCSFHSHHAEVPQLK